MTLSERGHAARTDRHAGYVRIQENSAGYRALVQVGDIVCCVLPVVAARPSQVCSASPASFFCFSSSTLRVRAVLSFSFFSSLSFFLSHFRAFKQRFSSRFFFLSLFSFFLSFFPFFFARAVRRPDALAHYIRVSLGIVAATTTTATTTFNDDTTITTTNANSESA